MGSNGTSSPDTEGTTSEEPQWWNFLAPRTEMPMTQEEEEEEDATSTEWPFKTISSGNSKIFLRPRPKPARIRSKLRNNANAGKFTWEMGVWEMTFNLYDISFSIAQFLTSSA